LDKLRGARRYRAKRLLSSGEDPAQAPCGGVEGCD